MGVGKHIATVKINMCVPQQKNNPVERLMERKIFATIAPLLALHTLTDSPKRNRIAIPINHKFMIANYNPGEVKMDEKIDKSRILQSPSPEQRYSNNGGNSKLVSLLLLLPQFLACLKIKAMNLGKPSAVLLYTPCTLSISGCLIMGTG